MIVVSDATPLIALAKIRHLHLLSALFGEIFVPTAVFAEVTILGAGLPGAKELVAAHWLHVQPVRDQMHVAYLRADLDPGESEALVLAQELQAERLLLDEQRARTVAYLLGIPHIGTIGLLLLAKQTGKIAAVAPLVRRLREQNFYISDRLMAETLKAADE